VGEDLMLTHLVYINKYAKMCFLKKESHLQVLCKG